MWLHVQFRKLAVTENEKSAVCLKEHEVYVFGNRSACLLPGGHPCIPLSCADNTASVGTCKTVDPRLYWLVVAWRPRKLPQIQSNAVCFTLFATILFSIQDFSKESIAKSALLFCIDTCNFLPLLILFPDRDSMKRHSTLFRSDECKILQKSKQPSFEKGPIAEI